MSRYPLGRYEAILIQGVLRLQTVSSQYPLTFTVQETMDLLEVLYQERDSIFRALHTQDVGLSPTMYPCPSCQALCPLERTSGYYGVCAEYGDDFTLDVTGSLLTHRYAAPCNHEKK